MIKIENTEVFGWEAAIRGMRNPMNSWGWSDSRYCETLGSEHCLDCVYIKDCNGDEVVISTNYIIGPNDNKLMTKLANAGSVHAKYRRMITVYCDITAPLYWWKEFDTYKVGTVANSCSTMHKIHEKEFTLEDFSCEHLIGASLLGFKRMIDYINVCREEYLNTKDKKYWWQMIQLLPSSYNQKRTVMLNYEVLANIFEYRKSHKLDEWIAFCQWIKNLPYSEIITGETSLPEIASEYMRKRINVPKESSYQTTCNKDKLPKKDDDVPITGYVYDENIDKKEGGDNNE